MAGARPKKPAKKPKTYSHRTPGGGPIGPITVNEKGVLRDVAKRQKELDKIMGEK